MINSEESQPAVDFETLADPVFGDKPIPILAIDIPLETRLTFVDTEELTTEWLNPKAIADVLNKYDRWVYRRISELKIPSEVRVIDGVEIVTYPPYTIAVLKEELVWRETYHSLPSHLSFSFITELIGRSQGWTRKTMNEIGARPTRSEEDRGRLIDLYPKGVLTTLRRINMAVPMDDGWLNLNQLSLVANVDRQWLVRRLEEAGQEPERRRSALTGKISEYYSPDVVAFIERLKQERPVYGGEWMSANAIGELTGRNYSWVKKRLEKFKDFAEARQDDIGVTRSHYPPRVVESVLYESEQQRNALEVGDYISFKALYRAVGHTATTTTLILEELGIKPEARKDKLNRVREYYSPDVIDRIRIYDSQLEQLPNDKLVEATFCVGSLMARIRALKGQLKLLNTYGDIASEEQKATIAQELSRKQSEVKKAKQRYYRLAAKTIT